MHKPIYIALALSFCLLGNETLAKKKKRRYSGPPPTHPVLIWARSLNENNEREERKKAAFKLSQYSQQIFQEEATTALLKCSKDKDVEIKVLCTKGLGKAGTHSHQEMIRKQLIELYQNDPEIRDTVVRVFCTRKDTNPQVQDLLLDTLKKSQDYEELLTLVKYFEGQGTGTDKFVADLVEAYKKNDNLKLRISIVNALAEKAQGQPQVIQLLQQCAENAETPLVLTCLTGLQQQAKKEMKVWETLEKTVQSDDPDVILSSLDVMNVLPPTKNEKISARLSNLLEKMDDEETQEKAILALGVAGNQSQELVTLLSSVLVNKEMPDSSRIASALVIGKQAVLFPEEPKKLLTTCSKEEKSQTLKTACQLSLKDLELPREITTAPNSTNSKK